MNPIFLEYYPHENCRCYKMVDPWSRYNHKKLVLCREDEGYELAVEKAKSAIANCFNNATFLPIQQK